MGGDEKVRLNSRYIFLFAAILLTIIIPEYQLDGSTGNWMVFLELAFIAVAILPIDFTAAEKSEKIKNYLIIAGTIILSFVMYFLYQNYMDYQMLANGKISSWYILFILPAIIPMLIVHFCRWVKERLKGTELRENNEIDEF